MGGARARPVPHGAGRRGLDLAVAGAVILLQAGPFSFGVAHVKWRGLRASGATARGWLDPVDAGRRRAARRVRRAGRGVPRRAAQAARRVERAQLDLAGDLRDRRP